MHLYRYHPQRSEDYAHRYHHQYQPKETITTMTQPVTTTTANNEYQITYDRMSSLFVLDKKSPSGLRWGTRECIPNPAYAGKVAGSFHKSSGYWRVAINGSQISCHRIVHVLTNQIPCLSQYDRVDVSNNKGTEAVAAA